MAAANLAKLAAVAGAWQDPPVPAGSSDLLGVILASILALVAALTGSSAWTGALAGAKVVVRWLSLHSGVPAVLVAALLIAVGYRLLKRTARFVVEVAAVALALVAASELGWLRW